MAAANAKKATQVVTSQRNKAGAMAKQDAVALLKADHRKVEQLFAKYEETEDRNEKLQLAHQVCKELIIHTKIEEQIFYPACREKDVEDDMLDEAQVEHDGAKTLIAELIAGSPDDEYFDAKVKVLSEYIKHHVSEEERPRSGIFARAQKAGVDMTELGAKLQVRKQELMASTDENNLEPPEPRSLHPNKSVSNDNKENYRMPRNSNDRDRDDRGRFTDDDNNGRGGYSSRDRERDDEGRFTSGNGRGGYSSRGRDDDDRQSGYSSRGSDRNRDDEGRFTSSNGGRGGYSSRDRDDDDRQGGYSSRGSDRNRDDEGRFTSGGNGSRGGYSSRGRDDDDDRGGRGRGWYGDSAGHAEAAREGWEDRGSSRSASRGGNSSRSRDDDDDSRRGSRSGSGHGGWYGDSRGHAEAARLGRSLAPIRRVSSKVSAMRERRAYFTMTRVSGTKKGYQKPISGVRARG